jgi:hypothetical protein
MAVVGKRKRGNQKSVYIHIKQYEGGKVTKTEAITVPDATVGPVRAAIWALLQKQFKAT